jgi:protoporphyrinogen oxidase
MKNNTAYIILGGGLSGLSYAYGQLRKGSRSITIIEKENIIGGLMRTFELNGFLFDLGPHIFRSKDERILQFVKNLLNNDYFKVSSNPAIFKYGKFFDNVIPSITFRNIENLPGKIKDKVKKELQHLEKSNKNISCGTNFEECIRSQVGETLYWEFFGEYTKKFWGMDPKSLSSDLAPKNLEISAEKSYAHLTIGFEKPTEEIYPSKGGIFRIVKELENKILATGGIILTGANVKKLEVDGDEIANIVIEKDGEEVEISARRKQVISTIPLTAVCKMLGINADLKYRGDIFIFIKLRGNKIFDYSWIYFHDPDVIFSRIYEPIYYSIYNAPKGYTSFCVEVTSFENDILWKDKYLADKVIEQLIDLKIIKKEQEPSVLAVEKYAYAYPIYTIDYKLKLENIFNQLSYIKNLEFVGRTGSFKYLNMWECLKWAVY